jgi:glycosyltransferase involved in cell wall biosynthesis
LPELQSDENVLLVPPDDASALANAIDRVLNDDPLRVRLRQGAAKLSRLFQWDHIALETIKAFEYAVQLARV